MSYMWNLIWCCTPSKFPRSAWLIALILFGCHPSYGEDKIPGLELLRERGIEIADSAPLPPDYSEDYGVLCGPNSAYVFATLLGAKPRYESFTNRFEIDPVKGVSVAQVTAQLAKKGIAAKAYNLPPSELSEIPVPFIGLLRTDKAKLNHFVTVLKVGEERIDFLDGTTFAYVEHPASSFADRYAGVAIFVPKRRFNFLAILFGFSGIVATFTVILKSRDGALAVTKNEEVEHDS